MNSPYLFDEYFTSGRNESASPFLTNSSKKWAKNLCLKSSIVSSFFLLVAFITSFYLLPLSNLFLIIVFFLSGIPALLATIEDIKKLELNIDLLMTLAAFLSVLIGSQMEGALLLVLFEFSAAMDHMVMGKARRSLNKLRSISPTFATVLSADGSHFQKSVKEITLGSFLLIKAGEIVPLDGNVMSGESFVNLVHLTGESIPISKKSGDEIQAGSRNLDGSLTIQVTRTSENSTITKLIHLINQAQEMKPKFQRFFDKFSKHYASTIICLSGFFTLVLPWILNISFLGSEGSIYRALTFLIAASPCALIIAIPTAYLSSISSCAKNGILLKGGITLDALASCKTIAFDKTGTLTTGKLTCTKVEAKFNEYHISTEDAISIAASLERHINHPMAAALCEYTESQNLSYIPITNFKAISGYGVEGNISFQGHNEHVFIGNEDLLFNKCDHFNYEEMKSLSAYLKTLDHMITILFVKKSLFFFHFLDTIRPGIKDLLHTLQEQFNLNIIMLTGDHERSAKLVANQLGIKNYFSNLRPENKLEIVSKLSSKHGLAMVGDGINDAPALTRATVGISMGQIGSDTAIDASDIVLLHDELGLLSWLIKKAHKTTRIVKENIILALCVIFLVTTPALIGLVPLFIAVLLHEGSTVLVGLNSLRLLKK